MAFLFTMDVAQITQDLTGHFYGGPVHHQNTVDSTNLWAKKALKEGTGAGVVFLADHQTAGRGREQRSWESPAGKNVLMSLIDSLPQDRSRAYQLTLVAGLAFQKALKKLFPTIPFKLKWPNDILVNGRKIAGILCEAEKNAVIIGVGFNVNSRPEDFSLEVASIATSLVQELKTPVSREGLVTAALLSYENERRLYDQKGLGPIIEAWNLESAHSGKSLTVSDQGQTINGIYEGLDADGFLLLRTAEGTRKVIAGDILLRPATTQS